jgi:hypothetical protein
MIAIARKHRVLAALAVLAVAAIGWCALAPVRYPTRDALFEIPKGTWSRRMQGEKVEILPSQIRLALGIRDVLVLKNLDDVPQIFGPTLLMPGQSFRLPFQIASENQFMCTAHASGSMTVIVDEQPSSPWARLRWRTNMLVQEVDGMFLHARGQLRG